MCDGERGQREVVGQKRQPLRRVGIDITHATQLVGIVASRRRGGQADRVIRHEAGREIDGMRPASSESNPLLRASHEERRFIGEAMQAFV